MPLLPGDITLGTIEAKAIRMADGSIVDGYVIPFTVRGQHKGLVAMPMSSYTPEIATAKIRQEAEKIIKLVDVFGVE